MEQIYENSAAYIREDVIDFYGGIAGTNHISIRMQQRGISREMINAAIKFGVELPNGRVLLGRKEIDYSIRYLKNLVSLNSACSEDFEDLKVLKAVRNKGGITVVCEDNTCVTAWNQIAKHQRNRPHFSKKKSMQKDIEYDWKLIC